MDEFVARQPIFDKNNRVVAYELLFRDGSDNSYNNKDGDKATLEVIKNSFYNLGIHNITEGKKAFINFTEKTLEYEIATIVSPDILTVEILENVEPTNDVINQCRKLKNLGYTIALDDFMFSEKYRGLIELADIIKVDFKITKGRDREKIINRVNSSKIEFLAEKVENIEEFNEAVSYGYSYFQGYYFSKPVIVSGKDISSHKFEDLKILRELNDEKFDVDKLENFILRDVSLSYKLLKFINSPIFGFRKEIKSIRHAISLLGEKEVIKWFYVVSIKNAGKDKSDELINCALIRAKFSELLCNRISLKVNPFHAYITGMFSLIDAIIGRPMEEILNEILIPNDVKEALLGKSNHLNSILKLIINYEKCEWHKACRYCRKLGINENDACEAYLEALKWINDIKDN